jgi:hypothetical protein
LKEQPPTPSQTAINQGTTNPALLQAKTLFDQQGFILFENVFEPTYIDSLREAYLARIQPYTTAEYLEKHYKQVGHLRYQLQIDMTTPFNNPIIYAHPQLLAFIHLLLGDDCKLDSFGSIISLPEAKMQHLHADHPPLFAENEALCTQMPTYAITLAIPLIDIDLQCGTTAFWLGTHKQVFQPNSATFNTADASYPVPKRGSVYLWDYRLMHLGTPNSSLSPRPLLYLAYSRNWFYDSINSDYEAPIKISREELNKVPDYAKPLFARCFSPAYRLT